MTIITLSNGKRVGNFSSPHEFKFEDGNILPAVSNEEAERLAVKFIELEATNGDVELMFSITPEIKERMADWYQLYLNDEVHVVFCPLPMIMQLKQDGYTIEASPFRSIRIEDRTNKLVSIKKQCI